jgi:hypothetical protein
MTKPKPTKPPAHKQSLEQALHLARTNKSRDLNRAASMLDGLPCGGWPQTTQALAELSDLLPLRDDRAYTVAEFIDAAYKLRPHKNAADTYEKALSFGDDEAK